MLSLRHIIFPILLLIAGMAKGESYTVYSVHGNVTEHTVEGNIPLCARDTHLTDESQIIIGKGGSLTLFLQESRELVSVNEYGRQRLATLVSRHRDKGGNTWRWVKSLVTSLFSADTPENTHRKLLQSQGGSHRGDDEDKALLNAFAGFCHYGISDRKAAVTFRLIDDNGSAITAPFDFDGLASAEVTNSTDQYMFVNIVAVSGQDRQLLLPVDPDADNNCCAHLCIPPRSTVNMSELAFFPSLLPRDATLVLVASPVEVNFTILCSPEVRYDSSRHDSRACFFAL